MGEGHVRIHGRYDLEDVKYNLRGLLPPKSPNYNNYVVQVQDMQTHASIAQSIANKNAN